MYKKKYYTVRIPPTLFQNLFLGSNFLIVGFINRITNQKINKTVAIGKIKTKKKIKKSNRISFKTQTNNETTSIENW